MDFSAPRSMIPIQGVGVGLKALRFLARDFASVFADFSRPRFPAGFFVRDSLAHA